MLGVNYYYRQGGANHITSARHVPMYVHAAYVWIEDLDVQCSRGMAVYM